MASRIVVRAARLVRNQSVCAVRSRPVVSRAFSVTAVKAAKVSGQVVKREKKAVSPVTLLSQVLDDEIEFAQKEVESEEGENAEALLSVVKEQGFEVISAPESDIVTLAKTAPDGTEIIIKFSASAANAIFSPNDMNQFDDELNEDVGEEEDDFQFDDGDSAEVATKITLSKPGAGTLQVTAIAQFGQLALEQITFYKDSELALSDSVEAESKKRNLYAGTPFQDLDPKLQEALQKYLESYGITNDIGDFVIEYSKQVENGLYLSTLQSLKSFVKS